MESRIWFVKLHKNRQNDFPKAAQRNQEFSNPRSANCELENTQINGSSFGLAGSMGTGSGQSPSSLDHIWQPPPVAYLSGAQESGNITVFVFSVFLFVPPAGLLFQGWDNCFFLRDSQNWIYQNCSNLSQINQSLKGVPFGLNPAKIINYFLFYFIYLSLKGTLSLKGGSR